MCSLSRFWENSLYIQIIFSYMLYIINQTMLVEWNLYILHARHISTVVEICYIHCSLSKETSLPLHRCDMVLMLILMSWFIISNRYDKYTGKIRLLYFVYFSMKFVSYHPSCLRRHSEGRKVMSKNIWHSYLVCETQVFSVHLLIKQAYLRDVVLRNWYRIFLICQYAFLFERN